MDAPSVSQFAQYALLMISDDHDPAPASYQDSRVSGSLHRVKSLVLKRQLRCTSPPLLRCRRTGPVLLPGADSAFPHQQQLVAAVARRNERERNRVRQVNDGFQTLRQHVPNGVTNTKLSKVETLRSAVEYIKALQRLLDQDVAAVPSPSLSVCSGLSVGSESPHSTCSSSEEWMSYENVCHAEQQELMDFTPWCNRANL